MATKDTTKPLQVGDRVKIVTRDQTAADIKSGLYYPHFANLRGSVLKIYGEEASVLIDRTTLPEALAERHDTGEAAMRQRYLDGLSEEARNRMSAREKEFKLNYAVLVSLGDLSADDGSAPDADAKRVSSDELDAKEAEFLAARNKNGR